MPNGGQLLLSAANFDIDEHYARLNPAAIAGPFVLLEVTDSGIGIPKDVVAKIFDPFFTTKSIGDGTGLGLSTVAGIVNSHGGFIAVESAPGRTCFKIFLPAKKSLDANPPLAAEDPVPEGNGETILIVDDEPAIREVAQLILESHGYFVLLAQDGPEALALFALHMNKIAAVITDLAMPIMSGLMLVRALRRIQPSLKVIVSTGWADEVQTVEIAALGVGACLTKPFTTRNLLLKLGYILNGDVQEAA